jgi:predicted nucleotidyltransferase
LMLRASYPSEEHQRAAETITQFFSSNFDISSVLLVNSCARGKATRDSCLDINILAEPGFLRGQIQDLESGWTELEQADASIKILRTVGEYSVVHLDFVDGVFSPQVRDEASGPDGFELGIGNMLAYSVPLWETGDYLARLKTQWLPYYDEELRTERLSISSSYCLNNLHHVPFYIKRGLYFQCFDRLYNAYQEFLQALFISHRVYPIAYNKWIREQFEEILGLPLLYTQLTHLFEVRNFESKEIQRKADEVEKLLHQYASV